MRAIRWAMLGFVGAGLACGGDDVVQGPPASDGDAAADARAESGPAGDAPSTDAPPGDAPADRTEDEAQSEAGAPDALVCATHVRALVVNTMLMPGLNRFA